MKANILIHPTLKARADSLDLSKAAAKASYPTGKAAIRIAGVWHIRGAA